MSHIYIYIFVHLHHISIIVNPKYYAVLSLYHLANPSSIVTGHFNITCNESMHGGTLSTYSYADLTTSFYFGTSATITSVDQLNNGTSNEMVTLFSSTAVCMMFLHLLFIMVIIWEETPFGHVRIRLLFVLVLYMAVKLN